MTPPSFDLALPGRVWFGVGRSAELGRAVAALGRRALVVTGSRSDRFATLLDELRGTVDALTVVGAAGEPGVADARRAVDAGRAMAADVVVAIGGGSPIDLGKAVAMLLANGGDPMDYIEVVGAGKPITEVSVPLVAVPTTAGTGAEVTANAVLAIPEIVACQQQLGGSHRLDVRRHRHRVAQRLGEDAPDLGLRPAQTRVVDQPLIKTRRTARKTRGGQ